MAEFEGFIGPSYTLRAVNFDAQRSLNLYLERDESGEGKARAALLGTPGLTFFTNTGFSPIRGIWTGLIDNLPGETATDQCYVVSGQELLRVASNGATTLIGSVLTDAANSPVQFEVNGSQLLVSSAGLLWVYNGSSLTQVLFNDGVGKVNTLGTAVTWVSGSTFDASQVGGLIIINNVAYIIASFTDELDIVLASSAGTQNDVPFTVPTGAGTVTTIGTLVIAGAGATPFTGIPVNSPFEINGVIYNVASVMNAGQLNLLSSAGSQSNVQASYPQAVQASQIAYLDSFFIALPPNSKAFFVSASQDGTNWNPLDFALKSAFPDNIASIIVDHEDLWLFGSESTEVWQDTGGSAADVFFPFQRNPSSIQQQGCRSPFSPVQIGNGVAWIAGDTRGNPIAYLSSGFVIQRISTHAVERAWGGYSTITDALAFCYTQDGHQFWVISFPTANATWAYDATEGVWHERASLYMGTTLGRTFYSYHGYVYGQDLVGDWSNGNLYTLSLSAYTDNGTAITRIRTAPHLSQEEDWIFAGRMRLSLLGNASAPNPTLSYSDDLGQTFRSPRAASARRISSTNDTAVQNSEWRRLGRYRDRVYSVQMTDAVQIAITNAFLEFNPGNG